MQFLYKSVYGRKYYKKNFDKLILFKNKMIYHLVVRPMLTRTRKLDIKKIIIVRKRYNNFIFIVSCDNPCQIDQRDAIILK